MKKKDVVAMQVRELESLRKEIERRVDQAPRWNADPKDVQKSVAAGPLASEVNAPFQRANDAVVVHRRKPRFPIVHPAGVGGLHRA